MKRGRSSSIWEFFSKPCVEENQEIYTTCLNCPKKFKFSGSTSSLHYHLSQKHRELFGKLPNVNVDDITLLFGKFIAECYIPFTAIDNENIRAIFEQFGYKLPCSKTFKTSILPTIRMKIEETILEINPPFWSFTLDLWTAPNDDKILTVTGHYCDSTKIKYVQLCAEKLVRNNDGSVTSCTIRKTLKKQFQKYRITQDKIMSFTTDSGKDVVAAIEQLQFNNVVHFRCICHLVNLAVQDFIAHENTRNCLEKVRKIVASLRNSPKKLAALKVTIESFNAQFTCRNSTNDHDNNNNTDNTNNNIKFKKPKLDTCVRWGSTLIMIERFLEIEKFLIFCFSTSWPKNWPQIPHNTISKLRRIREILLPLQEFTKQMENRETPTISKLLPFLSVVIHQLESSIQNTDTAIAFQEKALPRLILLRSSLGQNKAILLATFLDPRFKSFDWFGAPRDGVTSCISWLASMLDAIEGSPVSPPGDIFTQSLCCNSGYPEVDKYREMTPYTQKAGYLDFNPLEFWKMWRGNNLSKIAQQYLIPPASSSESERSFSKLGNYFTKRRESLSSQSSEDLLLVNTNYNTLVLDNIHQ